MELPGPGLELRAPDPRRKSSSPLRLIPKKNNPSQSQRSQFKSRLRLCLPAREPQAALCFPLPLKRPGKQKVQIHHRQAEGNSLQDYEGRFICLISIAPQNDPLLQR
jgi:hypothetical protein